LPSAVSGVLTAYAIVFNVYLEEFLPHVADQSMG
jgi:hypothetical protein